MTAPGAPTERERAGVAWLFVAHVVVLLGFLVTGGIVSLWTASEAVSSMKDPASAWDVGLPVGLGMIQLLFAAGVLGGAVFEGLAAMRLLQGRDVPLRSPALVAIAASLLLLPAATVTCNPCGLALWPLPLGMALSTAFTAMRVPDPRQE